MLCLGCAAANERRRVSPAPSNRSLALPAEPEPADDRLVAFRAGPVEVSEEPPPLADHHEEPTATVVVVASLAKVFDQVLDAFGEERDLDLRRSRVRVMAAVRPDDLTLVRRGSERHPLSFPGSYGSLCSSPSYRLSPRPAPPSARLRRTGRLPAAVAWAVAARPGKARLASSAKRAACPPRHARSVSRAIPRPGTSAHPAVAART